MNIYFIISRYHVFLFHVKNKIHMIFHYIEGISKIKHIIYNIQREIILNFLKIDLVP